MIYTYRNAPRSTVIDAERGERIPRACEVDTAEGTVTEYVADEAGRLMLDPQHAAPMRRTVRFDFIHDIFVGRATPQLFVCYGRRGDAQ